MDVKQHSPPKAYAIGQAVPQRSKKTLDSVPRQKTRPLQRSEPYSPKRYFSRHQQPPSASASGSGLSPKFRSTGLREVESGVAMGSFSPSAMARVNRTSCQVLGESMFSRRCSALKLCHASHCIATERGSKLSSWAALCRL